MNNDTAEWSREVRKRDNHQCRWGFPGCQRMGTEAHHIFSRKYQNLRQDVDNGITVCKICHNWVEENTMQTREFMPRVIGEELWEKLVIKMKDYYGYI